ncbi:MAG: hypothetical protein MH252_12135 [Thermosynechococcaceae cyanobacterium MS004]|nr:hypothetical protein [Thermosynechococcaceae cyanobacterium MS004]
MLVTPLEKETSPIFNAEAPVAGETLHPFDASEFDDSKFDGSEFDSSEFDTSEFDTSALDPSEIELPERFSWLEYFKGIPSWVYGVNLGLIVLGWLPLAVVLIARLQRPAPPLIIAKPLAPQVQYSLQPQKLIPKTVQKPARITQKLASKKPKAPVPKSPSKSVPKKAAPQSAPTATLVLKRLQEKKTQVKKPASQATVALKPTSQGNQPRRVRKRPARLAALTPRLRQKIRRQKAIASAPRRTAPAAPAQNVSQVSAPTLALSLQPLQIPSEISELLNRFKAQDVDATAMADPTLFKDSSSVIKMALLEGNPPENVIDAFNNDLQSSGYTVSLNIPNLYANGYVYQVKNEAFSGFVNFVPEKDGRGVVVVFWKTAPLE